MRGCRARVGGARKCLGETRLGDRVVVDEQHPVHAAFDRASDAGVAPAREAEVRSRADQLDLGG